jgi:hypothetical protein
MILPPIPPPPNDAPTNTAERTALKEWAVLARAMGRGEMIAMVRKGGIREQRAGFSVRHDRFLLYPTYFHEKAAELQPRFIAALDEAAAERPTPGVIRIELVAQVAAVWRVGALESLRGIAHEHGLAWPAVESRFHYRGEPGVQVVAVRIARLAEPIELPEIRRYAGCVSWVELDTDVDVAGARDVIERGELDDRLARLRDVLGAPTRD